MKTLFTLILTIVVPCLSLEAGSWRWVKGGDFKAVSVVSDHEIWLAGELMIHGEKDTKWHWSHQCKELTEDDRVLFLDFYDKLHGFAVTEKSLAYTEDGGRTWERYPKPQEFKISDICMTGENTIYAVGEENTHEGQAVIAVTEDKGKSWRILFKSQFYFGGILTDIVMFSDGYGYAVGTFYDGWGSHGVVFGTEDGWKTTRRIFTSRDHDLWLISAPTKKDLFVAGGDTTTNPYATHLMVNWGEDQVSAYSYDFNLPDDLSRIDSIYFISNETGWIGGRYDNREEYESGGVILRTDDGGSTFFRKNFTGYSFISTIFHIFSAGDQLFASQHHMEGGFPCPGICTGIVMTSTDGGYSWSTIEKLSGYPYIKAEIFNTPQGNKVYLLGAGGLVQVILNGEAGPVKFPIRDSLPVGTYCRIQDMEMNDPENGWASFCYSLDVTSVNLIKTTDGWNTCSEVPVPPLGNMFISSSEIKVFGREIWMDVEGGGGYYIAKSYDGGSSWELEENNLLLNIKSMEVFGGKRYILSSYGTLFYSTDSGKSWTPVSNTLSFATYRFFNENTGVALEREKKKLLKTYDGGNLWGYLGEVPSSRVSLDFADEFRGIASEHSLYETVNGGVSWIKVKDGVCPASPLSVSISKDMSAVATSRSGMVLLRDPDPSFSPIKAYPAQPLPGRVYSQGMSLAPQVTLEVPAGRNTYILPAILTGEDSHKTARTIKLIYLPQSNTWINLGGEEVELRDVLILDFFSEPLDLSSLRGLTFQVYLGYETQGKIVFNSYQVTIK